MACLAQSWLSYLGKLKRPEGVDSSPSGETKDVRDPIHFSSELVEDN